MNMSDNTISNLRTGLKMDIGISSSSTIYDGRLDAYINRAIAEIERQGATLSETSESTELIIAYAAWLWRTRDTMAGMPRSLRFSLNNLIFSQKMKGSDS